MFSFRPRKHTSGSNSGQKSHSTESLSCEHVSERGLGKEPYYKFESSSLSTIYRDGLGSEVYYEDEVKYFPINEDESSYLLKYFESALFATVLEDTITSFRILAECNNKMKIRLTTADMKRLENLKYGVEEPEITDELHGVHQHNIGSSEFKLVKLRKERNLVTDILTDTYKDLSLKWNFQPLCKAIKDTQDHKKYETLLEETEAKNKAHRQELRKHLRMQHNQHKSVIYDADVSIEELRKKVEDTALMAETNSRYVGHWQRSRSEQQQMVIEERERALATRIEENKSKCYGEQRVHTEIALINNIVMNEALGKVEEIMMQYDQDMDKIDLKIKIKSDQYHNMLNKRNELEKKIADRANEINEWIHFKAERQKVQEQQKSMHRSAIVVQAWWRGILVRLKLGPYKPKKRKNTKKKKK